MKRSDSEKQLRSEADAHTPDVFDRVMAEAEQDGGFVQTEKQAVYPAEPQKKSRKKLYLRIAVPVATVAVCAAIIVPMVFIDDDHGVPVPTASTPTVAEVYGMSAVSAARLIAQNANGAAYASRYGSGASASAESDNIHVGMLDKYLDAFDGFFDNAFSANAKMNADASYPFRTELTVRATSIDGNALQYTVYYTETLQSGAVISPSDANDKDKDKISDMSDKDESSERSYYKLNGIAVIDDIEYRLDGKRAVTADDTVESFMVKLYPDPSDDTTYAEIAQVALGKNADAQIEYTYTVVIDGQSAETTTVAVGRAKGSPGLKFKLGNDKNGEYSAKLDRSGSKLGFIVTYIKNGKTDEFKITRTDDGKYEYGV